MSAAAVEDGLHLRDRPWPREHEVLDGDEVVLERLRLVLGALQKRRAAGATGSARRRPTSRWETSRSRSSSAAAPSPGSPPAFWTSGGADAAVLRRARADEVLGITISGFRGGSRDRRRRREAPPGSSSSFGPSRMLPRS